MAAVFEKTFVYRYLFLYIFFVAVQLRVASCYDHDNDHAPPQPRQAVDTLKDCLAQTGARTIYSDSAAGNGGGDGTHADGGGIPKSQNTNYNYTPAVVVQPMSVEETAAVVQAIVHCARGGFRLSSFGGGHG